MSQLSVQSQKPLSKVRQESNKSAANLVVAAIQHSTDNSITINGRAYQLPSTKEYLVKEYADMFHRIGTQVGGNYHMQFMTNKLV